MGRQTECVSVFLSEADWSAITSFRWARGENVENVETLACPCHPRGIAHS